MEKIILGHGSGGRLMHNLIRDLFVKHFDNAQLKIMGDSAALGCLPGKAAFTTDSYVVKPLFFPGGDIGKLAVCGTVNDLTVSGFRPLYLSCAMIIEEGFDYKKLKKITMSLAETAAISGVVIVTGDTKVVEHSSCDGIFINTSGLGIAAPGGLDLSVDRICPGDKIVVTGPVGDHGIAVLSKRKELDFDFNVKSDCTNLNDLLLPLLERGCGIRFMRDPTRGGLATTLNEVVETVRLGIVINEKDIPVSGQVQTACSALGFDPLYIACEGRAVIFVSAGKAEKLLRCLKRHPKGRRSRMIGEVVSANRGKVCLKTKSAGLRFVDMPASDSLPRIC